MCDAFKLYMGRFGNVKESNTNWIALKRSGVRAPLAPFYFKSTYEIRPVGAFLFYEEFITVLSHFCRLFLKIGFCDGLRRTFLKTVNIQLPRAKKANYVKKGLRPIVFGHSPAEVSPNLRPAPPAPSSKSKVSGFGFSCPCPLSWLLGIEKWPAPRKLIQVVC